MAGLPWRSTCYGKYQSVIMMNDDDELFYLSTLTSSAKAGFHDRSVKQYKGKITLFTNKTKIAE